VGTLQYPPLKDYNPILNAHMTIIPIIIFLLGWYAYLRRHFDWFLFVATFFITSGYGFVDKEYFIVKPLDFLSVYGIVFCCIEYFHNKHFFSVKWDDIGKIIALILIYQLFEYLITVITKADTPAFAFKVARHSLIFIYYFLLRRIPLYHFERYFRKLYVISLIQGIFFYLQLVGVSGILNGRVDEATSASEITRYANGPRFARFFLLYYLFSNKPIVSKIFNIIFWGGSLLLGQGRTSLIIIALMIVIFVLYKNKVKYYPILIAGAVVAYFVVLPMFEYRSSRGAGSAVDDIKNVITANNITKLDDDGGTFTFRIAMLMERYNYLAQNPEYMLTGVGDIHEDSPNNRFFFKIGTFNKELQYRCVIESGDITWVPILLRYGIIGVGIYLLLLVVWLYKSIKRIRIINNLYIVIASLHSINYMIGTMSQAMFESGSSIFYVLLFIVLSMKGERTVKKLKLLSNERKSYKALYKQ